MTIESASAVLDAWATKSGRAPRYEPVLPTDPAAPPRADVLYRASPESLCIPGHDDKQEGDPDRNAMPLDEQMVLSIMAIGVLEPIMLKKVAGGTLEVIAGRRRTRHAREANKRLVLLGESPISVPVIVKAARITAEMASIIDTTLNEHRENDPPAVKVRKAAKMIARGIDITTVAVAYRVEVKAIDEWLQAAKAHPLVSEALNIGRITVRVAAELASMPTPEQPPALEKILERPEIRPAVVRAAVRQEPLPGRVPRGATRWILAAPEAFDPEFVRGIRFMKGELSEEEVRDIMAKVGR